MAFEQIHELQGTLKECFRELTVAIGHLDYELVGDQVIVRDHGRRVVIDLVYEGKRHLGSLDLPMTRLEYQFIGYTQKEIDDFMQNLNRHMLRLGG